MTTIPQSIKALDAQVSALREQVDKTVRVTVAAEQRRRLIRTTLILTRASAAAIGRKAGVSRGLVCHVIAGRKRHPKVEAALARVCRMKVAELWED